jgi:CheY-like chemotaxis protein
VSSARALEVLVVDDDEDTREVLVEVLRENGLDASPCGTGEEALALLQGHRFDALITDQVMPGITGLDLVHRARSIDASLRCVVLSGYPRPTGADVAWLKKPVSISALVGALC